MKRALLAALVTAAACSAGRPSAAPTITRVELRLVPGDGRAWVAFDTAGKARGGHMSGGAAPTVHIDTATIAADSARALFAAVRALDAALLARRGPPTDTARAGTATLAVTFSDSTQAQIVWTATSRPPGEHVQAVLDHVIANRIGGW